MGEEWYVLPMSSSLKMIAAAGIATALVMVGVTSARQAPAPRAAAFTRMPDGKPNLNGIWAANNTANWNIQTHEASQGPVTALGAAFSVPGGLGVVEGGDIPYRGEALAKRNANAANWMANDPEVKCYLPGVPRATYMPYPFQIVQSTERNDILRDVRVRVGEPHRPHEHRRRKARSMPGWAGRRPDGKATRWSSTSQASSIRRGSTAPAITTATRCTSSSATRRRDRTSIRYEATIEDPKVFTRAWKMSMPLYRRLEKDAQLMEYKCVEFAEELMYGHLEQAQAVTRRREERNEADACVTGAWCQSAGSRPF